MQRKNYIRILIFAVAASLILIMYYSNLGSMLTLQNLQMQRENLLAIVNQHYRLSIILYVVIYTLITAASIPGAAVLTIAGGFLFGLIATLYVIIGASIGAIGAFLFVRYTLGSVIQKKYAPSLRYFNKQLELHGVSFLFAVRLIPIIPFFLINILAGLITVSILTFGITTVLGIIPVTFMYVLAGKNLATVQNVRDILSWPIIIPLLNYCLFNFDC